MENGLGLILSRFVKDMMTIYGTDCSYILGHTIIVQYVNIFDPYTERCNIGDYGTQRGAI